METLLVDNKICGLNIELAKVFSNQGRYYLRLGNKQEGYSKNARAQVDAGVYNPPRHQHINFMQKRLHQLLSNSNTPDDYSDIDDSEAKNDGNKSISSGKDTAILGGIGIGSDKFQILRKLGINLDLTYKPNANCVKDITGKLLVLQLRYSYDDKKATNELYWCKSTKTVYPISLMSHASGYTFKKYH